VSLGSQGVAGIQEHQSFANRVEASALSLVKKTVKRCNGVSLGERCAWRFLRHGRGGNNNMINPTKLMRGAFLALAILGAAPLAGSSIALLGVVTAQAQEQLVGAVLFEGNRRFSDSQLLAMVDVSASGIFTQQRVNSDIESIRQAYDRDGFLSVSVTARSEATADGRVRVIFNVNEGNRAGIAAINFTGNNSFGANSLKSVMLTKETGILSWLFKDDSYNEQK